MAIVSISGRKGSGKSEISKLLINRGFIKISFADTLKQLVCTLYSWDLSKMGDLSYKEIETVSEWTPSIARKAEQLLSLPGNVLDSEERIFSSRREALQQIGTDILRKYDENFHVTSLLNKLQPDINYVLDDTRYPNELEALQRRNAICLFVIRPSDFAFSNHTSEISLTRHNFTHVLLNDKSLSALHNSANWFFNTILFGTSKPKYSASDVINMLSVADRTHEVAYRLNCSRDKLVWWARKYLLRIEDRDYRINDDAFSYPTQEAGYWAGYLSADGCIKKSGLSKTSYVIDLSSIDKCVIESFKAFLHTDKPIYSNTSISGYSSNNISYYLVVSGSLLIEDIKLWNLRERKGVYTEIPEIARNYPDVLKAWFVGLLDGDGSIYISNKGLTIKFLASKSVLEFLSTWCSIRHGAIHQEKQVEGLYGISFHGKYAKQFKAWLNPNGFGLQRKWNRCSSDLATTEFIPFPSTITNPLVDSVCQTLSI